MGGRGGDNGDEATGVIPLAITVLKYVKRMSRLPVLSIFFFFLMSHLFLSKRPYILGRGHRRAAAFPSMHLGGRQQMHGGVGAHPFQSCDRIFTFPLRASDCVCGRRTTPHLP